MINLLYILSIAFTLIDIYASDANSDAIARARRACDLPKSFLNNTTTGPENVTEYIDPESIPYTNRTQVNW